MFQYQYEMPSVTTDVIVWRYSNEKKQCEFLLIKRGNNPYKNFWALPGGYINMNEELHISAARELKEETGISADPSRMEFYNFGADPKRDTRGRVITFFFCYFLGEKESASIEAGDDAKEVKWFTETDVIGMELAFDHKIFVSSFIGGI